MKKIVLSKVKYFLQRGGASLKLVITNIQESVQQFVNSHLNSDGSLFVSSV